MKDKLKVLFAILSSICVILVLLITSIDYHAFNTSFYESEYASMETAKEIGMTQKDLMRSTKTLLDYLHDDRDDIDVSAHIKGNKREVFNEKEAMHMVDVKALYQNVLSLRMIALIGGAIMLIYLFVRFKSKALITLSYRYMQVAIVFLILIAALSIWAICDFYTFWTSFHQLFFTNDLWLLNPATDVMINMFPQDFFFHMVLRIVLTFALFFIALFGLSLWYVKRWMKVEGLTNTDKKTPLQSSSTSDTIVTSKE